MNSSPLGSPSWREQSGIEELIFGLETDSTHHSGDQNSSTDHCGNDAEIEGLVGEGGNRGRLEGVWQLVESESTPFRGKPMFLQCVLAEDGETTYGRMLCSHDMIDEWEANVSSTSSTPQHDQEWNLMAELLPAIDVQGIPLRRTSAERKIKMKLSSGNLGRRLESEFSEDDVQVLWGILVEIPNDPNSMCMLWEDFSQQHFRRYLEKETRVQHGALDRVATLALVCCVDMCGDIGFCLGTDGSNSSLFRNGWYHCFSV